MVDRQGSQIEVRLKSHDGADATASAYVAIPHSGAGPGVLVVHDEWGFNDFARDACDRLARADFVALAPDFFRGKRARSAAEADRLSSELDVERALGILEAAIVELFNQHATDGGSVGAIGFATGGRLALALAARSARVGAVASICGRHPSIEPDFRAGASPAAVLAIFAGGDGSGETEREADRLRASLADAGVRSSVQVRGGVRSGFMDDSRADVHDAVAEFESWDAVLSFFRAELP